MKMLTTFLFFASLFLTTTVFATDVGVFYYPGWNKPEVSDGWEKIRKFSDREPLLGWYEEGADNITKMQIDWWRRYGIDYVAYDWYWDKGSGPKNRTYAIDSFIRNSQASGVEFALLWANHTDTPVSYEDFDSIVNYWLEHYFRNSNYKKIDDMPVVFIFSPEFLDRDARKFGSNSRILLDRARTAAKKSGFKDIYFVGATQPNLQQISVDLPDQGYNALSAYNYQNASGPDLSKRALSENYNELSSGYIQNWKFIINNSKLPYIIPVTSGWDKRPWGGSVISAHDNSNSTPDSFFDHLVQAKKTLAANPEKTLGVVVCCWNEFGEGSYIEPTKKFGFEYLEKLRMVFGAKAQ